MTPEFTIREAALKDVPAIAVLGRATYKEHFSDIWHNIDSFLDTDFTHDAIESCINSPSSHRYLLALKSDVLIGFAKLNINSELKDMGKLCIELQKIYVKKDNVGNNLGSVLLHKVMELALALGSKYVWLDVLKNNVQAQRFYQRHQFSIVDEIPYKTDKYELGMFVMVKMLEK
ncbi:GNAT family N-acetyltransferase [Teredinibacter turnerae]|uniref:GNAT family N-acetyltransferase n=1 Tax=Teredinibacter turnerae TaxID=2426 RepID=UPI0003641AA2|nr:GNAT family N-acetyltransferase [Teredinibacter turnerae]